MGCSGPLYNTASPEQPLLSCSIFVHRFSSMGCSGPLYNTASPEQPPLSCSIFVHRFSLIVDLSLARRNARSAWNPPPLPYGKRWRVKSKAEVRNCKSQICRSLTPLKSPPSAPAHSARPPQNAHPIDFVIFKNSSQCRARSTKTMHPGPW